jgi:hypothetical protein
MEGFKHTKRPHVNTKMLNWEDFHPGRFLSVDDFYPLAIFTYEGQKNFPNISLTMLV